MNPEKIRLEEDKKEIRGKVILISWYCPNLMRIALELSTYNPIYQDLAIKFSEHFLYIAGAMRNIGNKGIDLWNEDELF